MTVPAEEAIAALSSFSIEDEQPTAQGVGVWISTERYATCSPIAYSDVSAFGLSLQEDTEAINQLNVLIQEAKEMSSVLYTYRSCVKALPQLPDSMKDSQGELYLETYKVLDLEMSRLRALQQWQISAASKFAADMQQFSSPEKCINGPTVTHLWSMLKLLDVLVQLDHLKNAKSSIPNDFSWYKRTFSQVSVQWQNYDLMREELDDLQIFLSSRWAILLNLQIEMFRVNNVEDILHVLIIFAVESLELDFALLFPERHIILRVLPILIVLVTSIEKDSESLYRNVKLNRLINIFKNDPVVPAFPDLHLSPSSILKELSAFFPKLCIHTRLLTLPAPHELLHREIIDYQKGYLIVNHISSIRSEHDEFITRFSLAMNKLLLLKEIDNVDSERCKSVKGKMYDAVVDGFQLLSRWNGLIWEQCAWKFSHPCKDRIPIEAHESSITDYEKVVRYNHNAEERKALVELVSYVKNVGSLMGHHNTLVTDSLWETIHSEVQEFVQGTLATMLRTTFRKKKDLSRIISDMRTLSADWMANTNNSETEYQQFCPRAVAPTPAQVHCLQFLICEAVSGGNLVKYGGLFGTSSVEISPDDLKQLEVFFYKLRFFLHLLDFSETLGTLTDVGFLWFREFYLESSRVIQFPITCSLPWMLIDQVLSSENSGPFEYVLMPFDIYNDSAQYALATLKQRFLYDEIEAEADLCFDMFVSKLCDRIYTQYKSLAASEFLDPSFVSASDNGEKYSVQPFRFTVLFKMTRLQLLGRTINLRSEICNRINKLFRENIEYLFDRFESQDICAIVELGSFIDILKHTHHLLSKDLSIDSHECILNEMLENLSLVSYFSRLASQIWTEMQNDFLPNFILCNTTQRFVRSSKGFSVPVQRPSIPIAEPIFICGNKELNIAHHGCHKLYSGFFGLPHMFSIVKLLGSRSLPWLIRALLDHITEKIAMLELMITGLQETLPKSIGMLPYDGGVTGCMKVLKENLSWGTKAELKSEALHVIKEIGSVLYWFGLLDIVLREVDTFKIMQMAPWLGLIPGADGQMVFSQGGGESPVVNLFKSLSSTIATKFTHSDHTSFNTLSRQAEAADVLYKANINTGSVLEYTLAFTSAAMDRCSHKWSSVPKTGFIDITTSCDFYRIFSGLQIGYIEEYSHACAVTNDILGDAVAWGGCTIIYLLGQHLPFELFDFSYQLLNVAEAEDAASLLYTQKTHTSQGWEGMVEAMKKSRRLNKHVFSVLKARCPLEDKRAYGVKQSGTPLHNISFPNSLSAFETLPLRSSIPPL